MHHLAQLPATFQRVRPCPPRVVVCQVSRGVAPVMPIVEACTKARDFEAGYYLIAGLPLVEAKNKAVEIAERLGADLLLIEDDILAEDSVWFAMMQQDGVVKLVETKCRGGSINTKRDSSGRVLYSGNVMTMIPLAVLGRLPHPVFRAYDFTHNGDELIPQRENTRGHHSDVWFWYQVRQLDPTPGIREVGKVIHLLHPLNREKHELGKPCEVAMA